MQGMTESVSTGAPVRSRARLVWGIVAGMACGVPLSYLLCHGATLPGMLGLFFFILFGLVIGAAMFRVWAPLRPLTSATIGTGIALVVLVAWGGSLVWEGIVFPSDVAKEAVKQVVKIQGKTGGDVRAGAAGAVREYLAQHYPPGGVIGYWRWAMAEKAIEIPIMGARNPKPIPYSGNGWMFIARVVLCGVGLTLAIYSQVRPLSNSPRGEEGEGVQTEPVASGDDGRP